MQQTDRSTNQPYADSFTTSHPNFVFEDITRADISGLSDPKGTHVVASTNIKNDLAFLMTFRQATMLQNSKHTHKNTKHNATVSLF